MTTRKFELNVSSPYVTTEQTEIFELENAENYCQEEIEEILSDELDRMVWDYVSTGWTEI